MDELNAAITEYRSKWQQFVATRRDAAFFEALRPTALGWKVADRAEYDRLFREWHDLCDVIVDVAMNGRWVAKLHLKEDVRLEWNIPIVKLMLRRPGSTDAPGLDHIDFYSPQATRSDAILDAEPNLTWTRESNDIIQGYEWISIWFSGTEAKLKSNTVIDTVIAELQEHNQKILTR